MIDVTGMRAAAAKVQMIMPGHGVMLNATYVIALCDAYETAKKERDQARRYLGFSEAMLIGLLNKARIGLTDAGEFIANELEVREGSFLGRDGNPDDPDTAVYITEARETQLSVNAALAEIEAALAPETKNPPEANEGSGLVG